MLGRSDATATVTLRWGRAVRALCGTRIGGALATSFTRWWAARADHRRVDRLACALLANNALGLDRLGRRSLRVVQTVTGRLLAGAELAVGQGARVAGCSALARFLLGPDRGPTDARRGRGPSHARRASRHEEDHQGEPPQHRPSLGHAHDRPHATACPRPCLGPRQAISHRTNSVAPTSQATR